MQKTLTTTLPALVWALTLVALGAALLFALGDASAQQPPISASIVDDNELNTNSLCSGFVWSDGRCDLRIRVTDHDATDSDVTIVASPIFSGAFDASVITPDDTALGSQALGPTPSTYTIPGNTRQIFRLRMTPVVTARGPQYYQGYVRVHLGAGTSGRKLAEYTLTLQVPTPTSIAAEEFEANRIAVRWTMDERATTSIIAWWPRDDRSAREYAVRLQGVRYRIISNLQPSTCYVIKVQPTAPGRTIDPAQTEASTTASGAWSKTQGDACAVEPEEPYVPTTKTAGDIMVKERTDHKWTPLVMVYNSYSPFDHSMGESEHFTYEVKLMDKTACPATVEVRGWPRFWVGGDDSRNRRLGVIAGSVPPPPSEHVYLAEISATVDFSADDCLNDRAKTFTVYGITDYSGEPGEEFVYSRGSYASLRHTLIKRAGAAVKEQGPKLNVWAEDRHRVLASAAVPPKTSETTPTAYRTIHKGHSMGVHYVNGVGPADRAGKGIPQPNTAPRVTSGTDIIDIRNKELTHVLLPRPTSSGDGWVEFCVYIHGSERSLEDDTRYGKGDDVIHKYHRRWSKIGLKALTPIPFEYEQLYWYVSVLSREWPHAPKRQLTDRVNKHYRYPIEMQLYTEALNGHSQCNLAGTFTADYNESKWQTIYSGGPRTLDSDGKPSAWTDPATTYSLPQSQWGKLMNVRMRAVYGLPTGVTDVNHDMRPTTVTVGGTTYSYRSPSGTMLLKFTFAEMLGSESQAGITVRFD